MEQPAAPLDVRAVLFDLDGTLIDTIELIRVSMRHATRTVLGHEIPDAQSMENVGQPLLEQFRQLAPEHADELLQAYRSFNMAHHDELSAAYPGTLETLQELQRRGIPMGIVTSKGSQAAIRGIDRFGLRPFFEVVITADDVARHKPDPFPLTVAAERLGVALGYCMYVGDSPHDMRAAIAGGAVAVAALWGAFCPGDLLVDGTDFALQRIAELPGLLDGGHGVFAADTVRDRLDHP